MNQLFSKANAAQVVGGSYTDCAVIIPCLNEEAAIADVIAAFKRALPGARVHVCDNGSEDATAEVAARAGALVSRERRRGKGHAVRRLLRDTEAEVLVLVDGDMTYDASAAPKLVHYLRDNALDMVIGTRKSGDGAEYRPGHRFGNRVLTGTISTLFNADIRDMLSGYRVLSRRFAKSFPVDSRGFEIETEMTVHMLQVDASYAEVETAYSARPQNSQSKLNTWRDGARIARTIARLMLLERPIQVFGGLGLVAILLGIALFVPVLAEFYETGLVPRFPSLIVSVAFGLTGLISVFSGLILDGTTRTRRDMKRLFFLTWSSKPHSPDFSLRRPRSEPLEPGPETQATRKERHTFS